MWLLGDLEPSIQVFDRFAVRLWVFRNVDVGPEDLLYVSRQVHLFWPSEFPVTALDAGGLRDGLKRFPIVLDLSTVGEEPEG